MLNAITEEGPRGSNTDKQRESITSKLFRDNVLLLDSLFADKEELLEYEQEFTAYLLRSALKDAKKEASINPTRLMAS